LVCVCSFFHECAACGYPPIETQRAAIDFTQLQAETDKLSQLAAQHKMYIALGTVSRDGDRYYNCVQLIDPNGEYVGRYDKRALWGYDLQNFTHGSSPGVFDIDGVKVGFRICFEVRFPEYFRQLFNSAVELCFVCFNDTTASDLTDRYDIIKAHLVTRAVENCMTIVSVNNSAPFQAVPTAVFDPNGVTRAEATRGVEQLLVYDYVKPDADLGMVGRLTISRELTAKPHLEFAVRQI
jgi:predicted amidohydrolase